MSIVSGNSCLELNLCLFALHVTYRSSSKSGYMKIVSERVRRYREKLRQSGLRPVQLWVPDTRRPGFAQECRRQSNLLKGDAQEKETLDFLEEAADHEGWEE